MVRVKRLVGVLALVLVASGCAREPEFPAEIKIDRARQADVIAAFIHARFDALDAAVEAFPEFVRHVKSNIAAEDDRANDYLFRKGHTLHLETQLPTSAVVVRFLQSPEGAYLTPQDREFIERTRKQRERQLQALRESIDGTEYAHYSELAFEYGMATWYAHGHAITEALDQLPEETLKACAEAVRDAMFAHDRHDLWNAIIVNDPASFRVYRESGERPTLPALMRHPVADALRDAVGNGELSWGFNDSHSPTGGGAQNALADVIVETLDPSMFQAGLTSEGLDVVGFNRYLGYERRRDLRDRLIFATFDANPRPPLPGIDGGSAAEDD